MIREIKNLDEMLDFGRRLGESLPIGATVELVGDIGAGKTTLTKGIARGMAVDEDVQSPSFTISRLYSAPDERFLAHYDFYRLSDPGIMTAELTEALEDEQTTVIVEWADVVEGALPDDRLTIHIASPTEQSRRLDISGADDII
jgi:tRNA threonylcarbamoyladenosine biosynthesis protein TsaE